MYLYYFFEFSAHAGKQCAVRAGAVFTQNTPATIAPAPTYSPFALPQLPGM
jgi:hypothetical protein